MANFPTEVTRDLGSWESALAECKRMNELNEAESGRCFAAVERLPVDLDKGGCRTMVRSERA
jgi:hypothetical protein